jgi:hypothetical protein
MTITFLLRCALIGAIMALIIQTIMLFKKKQPRSTWAKPLLKAGISGALLGLAGGLTGYFVAAWVAGFSQHWLVLLLFLDALQGKTLNSSCSSLLGSGQAALVAGFAVGLVLPLDKLGVNFNCLNA